MHKKVDKKIIIIILLIGVVGLSIGLAAFSSTLNIKSETTVSPDESSLNVGLSTSTTSIKGGTVIPTSDNESLLSSATNAVISEDGKSISNISVAFTEPGQIITYNFYIYNSGKLDAYFRRMNALRSENGGHTIRCTAGEGTTDALVQETCKSINIRFTSDELKTDHTMGDNTASINYLYEKKIISPNLYSDFSISIQYLDTDIRADGPFSVGIAPLEAIFNSI